MSATARLAAFGAALLVVLGAGTALGRAVAPVDRPAPATTTTMPEGQDHGVHG